MTIPMIKVPTYTMILPHTQRPVKYRPYLVKEEKLLINASESTAEQDMIDAIGDIVKDCTFGELDFNTTPMFDMQHAFLQIRGKSTGETFELLLLCGSEGCAHKTPITVSINDFKLKTHPGHTNVIDLDENYKVVMRYPTFKHFICLYDSADDSAIFQVVAECIERGYSNEEEFVGTPENLGELCEMVDGLTPEQFEKFETFFETMPILHNVIEYDCPKCSIHNSVVVDGISNFFE